MNKRRNPTWNREELILALDLYLNELDGRLPSGNKDPRVIELSELLRIKAKVAGIELNESYRNPGSIRFKLSNFRALDPNHETAGFSNFGSSDELVWNEFWRSKDQLRRVAQDIRDQLQGPTFTRALVDKSQRSIRETQPRFPDSELFGASTSDLASQIVSRAIMKLVLDGYQARRATPAESADVILTGSSGNSLNVFVRGTVLGDSSIHLSATEVEAALMSPDEFALFLVLDIQLRQDEEGNVLMIVGRDEYIHPLDLNRWTLVPNQFRLDVSEVLSS